MRAIIGLALVVSLFFFGFAYAANEGAPQEKCPVMDLKINKDIHVDVDGKRVYLCCDVCSEKLKADPAKYLKKMQDQGVAIEKL